MKYLIRLIPSIVLGLAAGYLYMTALSKAIRPVDFVAVGQDLAAGDRFASDNVERLRINGDPGKLSEAAVLYKDRGVLYNRPTNRDLKKGDIVFLRDTVLPPSELTAAEGEVALPVSLNGMNVVPQLLAAGDRIEFLKCGPEQAEGDTFDAAKQMLNSLGPKGKVKEKATLAADRTSIERIGPFRILSVGQRLASRSPRPGVDPSRSRGDEGVITVALTQGGDGKEFDAASARLVAVLSARPAAGKLMLVIHPPRTAPKAVASAASSPGASVSSK